MTGPTSRSTARSSATGSSTPRPAGSTSTRSRRSRAEIEEQLRTEGGEVGSDRIGVTVLERLRGLDHVAYLRFASVYKGFEDLADFEREVVELQKTTEPKRRLPN